MARRTPFPLLLLALLFSTATLQAQAPSFSGATIPRNPKDGDPKPISPDLARTATIDQNLDAQVPLDLHFRDEADRDVKLGEYFTGKRPVVLTLVYYECPMLCTQVLNGLVRALKVVNLEPGKDFELVTVSFNPRETPTLAAEKKFSYLEQYDKPSAADAWHFLTGDSANIAQLANAVGFRYAYDTSSGQYIHASAIMVLTPGGKVSAYQFGVEYSPRDLQLSLVNASEGNIGSLADKVLLLCYNYDPHTGTWGFTAMTAVRIVAILLVGGLVTFMVRNIRRDRRRRSAEDATLKQMASRS